MAFSDPIVGTINLIRQAIQSPNFLSGVQGWTIRADGSAEFNDIVIRGGTIVSGKALYYSGAPALGNLIASIAAAPGIDDFGNAYVQGVAVYKNDGSYIQLNNDATYGAAMVINPPNLGGSTWLPGGVLSFESGGFPFVDFFGATEVSGIAARPVIRFQGGDVLNTLRESINIKARNVYRSWSGVGDFPIPLMLSGQVAFNFVAQTTVDVAVVFNPPFNVQPEVTATFMTTGTLPAGSSALIVRAFNVTAAGMTLRANDVGAVARTLTIVAAWHAHDNS